jgi:hypothetical protein
VFFFASTDRKSKTPNEVELDPRVYGFETDRGRVFLYRSSKNQILKGEEIPTWQKFGMFMSVFKTVEGQG